MNAATTGTTGTSRIAAIQMVSGPTVADNLEEAGRLIAMAAAQGAQLVALPEYFCIMGMKDTDKVAVRETLGAGPIQSFLSATAKQHGVWVVGGSAPLVSSDPGKVRNSSLVFDATGARVARATTKFICSDLRWARSVITKPAPSKRATHR